MSNVFVYFLSAKPDNNDSSDHTSDTPQTPHTPSLPHTPLASLPQTPKTPRSARFDDGQFFGKDFSLDTLADAAISRPSKAILTIVSIY